MFVSEEQPEILEEDFIVQYGNIWGDEEAGSIADVLESDVLVEGEKVKEFEKKFAEFVGAKYCVLLPNPTLAVYSALVVLKGKILTQYIRIPDFGYIELFNASIMAGYIPVLCDVNETGVLELRDNESGVACHFNGRIAKPTLLEICFDTPSLHTKGLMSVYDFNSERLVSLGGKGAAICTDDETDYTNLLRFKNKGRLEADSIIYDHWGSDLQVVELQAAFGVVQLADLKNKLNKISGFYTKIKNAFTDTDKIVFLSETPSMWIDIYTKEPLKLGKFLSDNGILSNMLPKPLHTQPICVTAQRLDKDFQFSNTLYGAGLFLPSSPIMEESQVDKIIDVLKKYIESN